MIKPRPHRPIADIHKHDMAIMLAKHPEAFDCLVFPAKSGDNNEVVAINKNDDVVTSLESSERRQSYDEPVVARALIIPDDAAEFGMLDDGLSESIHGGSQAINIKLSLDGVRKYSLIQWKEYGTPDATEPETKTLYVHDLKSIGHSLGVGAICVCHPLFALGEVPEMIATEEVPTLEVGVNDEKVGVL